jgi:hypothetical protein
MILAGALALIAAAPAPQATPPPTPPPLNPAASPNPQGTVTIPLTPGMATASPEPTLSPLPLPRGRGGRERRAGGTATPTPPPDTRKGLDGVWEIQIQRGPKTEYEHMNLAQHGETLTGYYLTEQKKKFPITGTLDDTHSVRLVVSRPDGTTILLEARVDGTTDMLGMFTDSKERVPFTAAYRPKEKFIDNINASPGGLGGTGGGP